MLKALSGLLLLLALAYIAINFVELLAPRSAENLAYVA